MGLQKSLTLGSEVDGIWGIWGSCYNLPKAIFHLLKGACNPLGLINLNVNSIGLKV